MGKYDLSIQNYKEALRLNPEYTAAIRDLRIALEAQNKINESLRKKKKTP
jgi:tetratricopeptide (TPR) repeat protein